MHVVKIIENAFGKYHENTKGKNQEDTCGQDHTQMNVVKIKDIHLFSIMRIQRVGGCIW
jgi:hypothetical protein